MTKKLAIIIKSDGTHSIRPEFEVSLESLQRVVGGYIEPVYLESNSKSLIEETFKVELIPGTLAYANEEGLIQGLPVNQLASRLLGRHLVGDIIIVHDE